MWNRNALGATAILLVIVSASACASSSVSTHGSHGMTDPSESTMSGMTDGMSDGSGVTAPQGLTSDMNGYRLVTHRTQVSSGAPATFTFTIQDSAGKAVTNYAVENDKKMHLIVLRKDLTGYQHLHPELATDGTWSVRLTLNDAGPYRVFADFLPQKVADASGSPVVLGADVSVPGSYAPRSLPGPARSASADGYVVTLDGTAAAGAETMLTYTVKKDGKPVTNLEPYLGSLGHLVSIRASDLGYTHTHPMAADGGGPDVSFHVSFATAGSYRQFFQFQTNGKVHTVAFTLVAA